MSDYSYIFNAHPSYIETMYQKYLSNPEGIEDGWRTFFQGFDFASSNGNGSVNGSAKSASIEEMTKEFGVMSIIHGFRDRGHLLSTTNPIRERKDRKPHLTLEDYGLNESDLNQSFRAGEEIGLKMLRYKKL